MNVLHEGIGVPRVGLEQVPVPGVNMTKTIGHAAKEKGFLDPFQPVDKIDDIEVSWTLGKIVLYAAGQVPPQENAVNLPVGFGANSAKVPPDFQHAGSNWTSLPYDGDDDWADDLAEDLVDSVKTRSGSGLLFFALIVILLAYLFRKRDRRMWAYSAFNSMFRRHHRRSGSPRKGGRGLAGLARKVFGTSSHTYERVMEEGDAVHFELGEAESDEGEHSDSSAVSRQARSSGLATPKLTVEHYDDLKKPSRPGLGNAIDRSGLVVRTESRERLTPHMLHAGRRSRTGSPTRLKSPMMSPLQED
jgi:hypothetical protein